MIPILATVLQVHRAWAWVVIVGNGLAGLWTLAAAKVPGLRTRALWWFVIFAEIAIVIQVLLGITLLLQGLRAPFFHYFYGVVATIFVSLMFLYKSRLRKKIYFWYGLFGLLLMGIGIRAVIVVTLGG